MFGLTDVIVDKPALVQVMVWCQTSIKPLPEPVLTKVPDATWHQQDTNSQYVMQMPNEK